MTAFQSTVNRVLGFGVPGELLFDGPHRAEPCIVNSNGAEPNVIGYAYTKNNQTGIASVGGVLATAAGSVTGSIAVNSATGSIAGFVLTVSAIGAGTVLAAGQSISNANIEAGTIIESQLTGTLGGVGTYQVNQEQTAASAAITVSGGGLTVTAVSSGTLQVGDTFTSGASAGTQITGLGTGTGGVGTYAVNNAQTVASTTLTTSAQGPGVVFAGILANPKVYATSGGSSGSLSPTLTLPDNSIGEFVTMGTIVVSLTSPGNIGDQVQYNTTTGALSAVAPGASASSGNALVPNALVWRYPTTDTTNGLTAIRLTN